MIERVPDAARVASDGQSGSERAVLAYCILFRED